MESFTKAINSALLSSNFVDVLQKNLELTNSDHDNIEQYLPGANFEIMHFTDFQNFKLVKDHVDKQKEFVGSGNMNHIHDMTANQVEADTQAQFDEQTATSPQESVDQLSHIIE